jgi:hypothetical protein
MSEKPGGKRRRGLWLALLALIVIGAPGGLMACAAVRLPNVSLRPTTPAAVPPLDVAEAQGVLEWRNETAPALRQLFQDTIYGAMPPAFPVRIAERVVLDEPAEGSIGRVERFTLEAQTSGGGPWENGKPIWDVVLVMPRGMGPFPVIIGGSFCGIDGAFPEFTGLRRPRLAVPQECEGGSIPPFLIEAIFGRLISRPPIEDITAAGYALAFYHPGEIAPDNGAAANVALAALTPVGAAPEHRTGAVAAWAWALSRTLDGLSTDPRLDTTRAIAWGHSRHGKAALLASAFDDRFAATIALQSGTAGASLGRDNVGESIAQITGSFPHWFSPAYSTWAGRESAMPVDQHQLIALIAPRPVLIGTGRRDQWGDPHGSFRALQGASPVYTLLGAQPSAQGDLRKPAETGPLAYYMRPGLHGIHTEDWEKTLAFLAGRVPAKAP